MSENVNLNLSLKHIKKYSTQTVKNKKKISKRTTLVCNVMIVIGSYTQTRMEEIMII